MVQRVVIESLSGAQVGISASLPATYDVAGYDVSSIIFTPVGQIESYGNHGMSAAVTEFTPVDTAVVAKVKGSKNYGMMSLVMANLPSDPGQVLLKTASESLSAVHYSIEVRYPDNEYHYLDVIVTKLEYVDGAVNDVQKLNVDLAICRKPVIVPQV
jgi:hypothetical protein